MPLFYAPLSGNPPSKLLELVVHLSSGFYQAARRTLTALLSATLFLAAGCHRNNIDSGYGIAWVTLTDSPGDFTSYIVNIDSITLTRNDTYVATALSTPETVDFTKLNNIAELWGTATIPTGTYVSASIVLDYTDAVISVMVDGVPKQATVVDSTGVAVTTVTINVILDPANPLVITPTYATTAAQRLALDFNLAASNGINLGTSPATVYVRPFITAAIAAPDTKLIRVRGPLINNSIDLLTYTVYVRPFYDEADDLGSLTLFTDDNTLYTINGVTSAGKAGLLQLSQSSAGSTVTAAYTTYTPTATPTATAAKYYAKYVIAGSTLEDIYTQGIEGDVIARNGDTLTLRGATLSISDTGSSTGNTTYYPTDSLLIVGPNTIVTADDSTLSGLTSNAIAVGQHVIARGECVSPCSAPITLNATGDTATNTGSVRLISTNLWGSLISSSAGTLSLNLQTINNWPVSDYDFSGNRAVPPPGPLAADYMVNTGALGVPAGVVAGDPLWIDGRTTSFGAAPPDFTAVDINAEATVPASLQVVWSPGAVTLFSSLTATGAAVDLNNEHIYSAVIRIGSESIDLKSLPASPQIIPTVAPAPTTATASATGSVPVSLPPVFLPSYAFGDPTAAAPGGISVYSTFDTFATSLTAALPTTPALQLVASGTYNRATNTFYANSIDVVL